MFKENGRQTIFTAQVQTLSMKMAGDQRLEQFFNPLHFIDHRLSGLLFGKIEILQKNFRNYSIFFGKHFSEQGKINITIWYLSNYFTSDLLAPPMHNIVQRTPHI